MGEFIFISGDNLPFENTGLLSFDLWGDDLVSNRRLCLWVGDLEMQGPSWVSVRRMRGKPI